MFTPDFIQQITLSAGFTVGAVEGLKRLLKIKGWLAICLSGIVSFTVCLPSVSLGLVGYLIHVACTCLAANGLFKAFHTPIK